MAEPKRHCEMTTGPDKPVLLGQTPLVLQTLARVEMRYPVVLTKNADDSFGRHYGGARRIESSGSVRWVFLGDCPSLGKSRDPRAATVRAPLQDRSSMVVP